MNQQERQQLCIFVIPPPHDWAKSSSYCLKKNQTYWNKCKNVLHIQKGLVSNRSTGVLPVNYFYFDLCRNWTQNPSIVELKRTDREQTENGEIIFNVGVQVLENPVQYTKPDEFVNHALETEWNLERGPSESGRELDGYWIAVNER